MSGDSLAALLYYRNARIRAWRAYGVPVEGGWVPKRDRTIWVWSCLAEGCGRAGAQTVFLWKDRPLQPLEDVERGSTFCYHLAPLLAQYDPPDLAGLVALELLAGDPPG